MGVFYSTDLAAAPGVGGPSVQALQYHLELYYLGETVGELLARGDTPQEFARHLYGPALLNPDAGLPPDPRFGITDADSLAGALERVIRWSSRVFLADYQARAGVVLTAFGVEMATVKLTGRHADRQQWQDGFDDDLIQAGFVRSAPWGVNGTKVIMIHPPDRGVKP